MKVKRFKYRFLLNDRKTKLRKGDVAVWKIGEPLRFFRRDQVLYIDTLDGRRCGFVGDAAMDNIEKAESVLGLLMAVHGGLDYKLVATRTQVIATFF
jgi:hypothetical protein